ncbi:MAG: hypothetical protein JZU64_11320 [Rhodoferax sp.]|jgi:hypothetical protein|nr:hypothetical protein [Rhodoferax sp.]
MPSFRHPLYHPDVGQHPLPDDAREIAAVLQATRRCYLAHPYFLARYGQRGMAFANSDGGYLASLTGSGQQQVDEQVFWLAGVLAARGMPRWLMEQHLELLCDELCQAVPDQPRRFGKLQQAAQQLRLARLAWIDQRQFDALAAAFESAAGDGLPNAGGLLVSAVCDDCCELPEALPSLTRWLADSGRFSVSWCAAVASTVAQARALAGASCRDKP